MESKKQVVLKRDSHASVIANDQLYIIGGTYEKDSNDEFLPIITFSISKKKLFLTF